MKRPFLVATLALLPVAFVPNPVGSAEPGPQTVVHRDAEAELRYLLGQYMLDPQWLRVAKLESGARLNSNVSRQANNYFGLHKAGKRKSTAVGRYGLYAKYASMEDCVADVRLWVDMSPQRDGEPFDRFLKRRGWNHLPHYWRTLRQVRI